MTTIGTSTATNSFTNAFGYPPNSMMDVNPVTGELWIVFQDQTGRGAVYKSSNNGSSWTSQGTFTVSGVTIEDIQEMRIDSSGRDMHLVIMTSNAGSEELRYKRVDISSGTANLALGTVRFAGPAGSSQSLIYSGALCPVANPDGSVHIFCAASERGATSGVRVYIITVRGDASRTTLVNDAAIGPTREWRVSFDDTSATVAIDVEHNGDGITSANPNMWLTWMTNTTIYCVRCTWKGYKAGWQTPASAAVVATGRTSERDVHGRWDGKRFVVMGVNPANNQQLQLFERNAANTANAATRTSPANGIASLIVGRALSYNHVTQDPRMFAVLSSQVYWIDYFRSTNSWGSWTATTWGAPIGGSNSEWGVRRGTAYTGQFDAYTETGGASPWTISSQSLSVNFAPTAPTWITGVAGAVERNGAAFDVSSSLLLDWDFHDPGVDSQSAFALSRQIGAGTVQWWRTSDNTWQTVETYNSSATTSITLTAAQWVGAGGASDPAHVYKVATKDSSSVASPYSDGLSLVPSTRVDPTVLTPSVDQILSTSLVDVTWSVTEQSAYRIKIAPSIANDNYGRTVSNSLGSADYGGAYTTSGGSASDYSVTGGTARHSHAALNVDHEGKLANVLAADINVLFGPIATQATATGAANVWGFRARYIDANDFVDCKVFFNTNSIATIQVRYCSAGVFTSSSAFAPSGIGAAGPAAIRFVAQGTDLMARMWNPSNPEPTNWQVTLANCPITAPGPVAIRTEVNTGNTNTLPFLFFYDGLIIQDAVATSYDSGWRSDPSPSAPSVLDVTPSRTFADGFAGLLTLQTRNAEGLASVPRTVTFTVDFVEPVTPVFTGLAADAANGGNDLTATAGSPSGSQPTTLRMGLYRRVALAGTTTALNANPFFETNATDWTASGFASVARSTAQFHQGVASLLATPDGTTASPKAQTTALYAVTAGALYEWRGWLRPTTANKTIRCYIDWYDNTPTLVGSSTRDLTPVAGVWLYGWFQATAPLGSTQARIAFGELTTPAVGDTIYGDELQLMVANPDTGFRVVANAQNGVTYLDWRAVTGVDYEYRAHVQASNGTDGYGPWYR